MKKTLPMLAASALLLCVHPPAASATTVVPITLEALAQRSDAVIVARVLEARVFARNRAGRVRLSTDVTLEVSACLRGALRPRQRVTLRLPGGATSTVVEEVIGVPELHTGDTVLAFLSSARDHDPTLFYLAHLTAALAALSVDARGEVVVARAPEGAIVSGEPRFATSATVLRRASTPLSSIAAAIGASR
jgi:hypothetical protein